MHTWGGINDMIFSEEVCEPIKENCVFFGWYESPVNGFVRLLSLLLVLSRFGKAS